MCKTYKVTPDSPFITEMDPVQKLWMFYSWVEDQKQDLNQLEQHAYLIGGFSNPEMLNKIIKNKENSVETDDKDFERSMQMVKESHKEEDKISKRRKRRKKIGS